VLPQFAFFDFDGTMVNSETVGRDAELQLLAFHGVHFDPEEFVKEYQLLSYSQFCAALVDITGIQGDWDRELAHAYEAAWTAHLQPFPGIEQFVHCLEGRFMITTNSSEHSLHRKLASAGLPLAWADGAVTGDMVMHRKPHPETYLQALENSGISPEEALVFEDSSIGIQAAIAAGIPVIGYPGGLESPEALMDAGAHLVLSDWYEALRRGRSEDDFLKR
jgi:HAD superfamily hydrolase (TIGR01509 family)